MSTPKSNRSFSRGTIAYLTWHTAYYVGPDGICFKVQDRNSERVIANHPALGHKLSRALHVDDRGNTVLVKQPSPGDRLVFDLNNPQGEGVLTSPLAARIVPRNVRGK